MFGSSVFRLGLTCTNIIDRIRLSNNLIFGSLLQTDFKTILRLVIVFQEFYKKQQTSNSFFIYSLFFVRFIQVLHEEFFSSFP